MFKKNEFKSVFTFGIKFKKLAFNKHSESPSDTGNTHVASATRGICESLSKAIEERAQEEKKKREPGALPNPGPTTSLKTNNSYLWAKHPGAVNWVKEVIGLSGK